MTMIAADAGDRVLVRAEHIADRARRQADQHENQRESGDERQRVGQNPAALGRGVDALEVLEGRPGEEREVGRNERQDARREKGGQPGQEGAGKFKCGVIGLLVYDGPACVPVTGFTS